MLLASFRMLLLQKSEPLLGLTKSAEFFDTANDMETSEYLQIT